MKKLILLCSFGLLGTFALAGNEIETIYSFDETGGKTCTTTVTTTTTDSDGNTTTTTTTTTGPCPTSCGC